MKKVFALMALAAMATTAFAQSPVLVGTYAMTPSGNCGLTVGIQWNDTATASGFFALDAQSVNIQQVAAFGGAIQVNNAADAAQFDVVDPGYVPANDSFWLVGAGAFATTPWTIAVPPFNGTTGDAGHPGNGNPGLNTYVASFGTGTSTPVSGTTPVLQLVTSHATGDVHIVGSVSRLGRDYQIDQSFTKQVAANPHLAATGGDAGLVRIGTSGSTQVTATNDGDPGSTLNATIGTASGEFSGGGGSAALLAPNSFFDVFTYIPVDHGTDSQVIAVTSDANNVNVNISGTGVGPEFGDDSMAGMINVGNIYFGVTSAASINITNVSPDAEAGGLTDLTITSLTVVGSNGIALWSASVADSTLSVGESTVLTVLADYNGIPQSIAGATLVVGTDVGAALGGDGADYSFQLKGFAVPEPSSIALAVFGALGLVGMVIRRRMA